MTIVGIFPWAENIKLAGYDPADVDAVLLTHLHPDHPCGITTPEGKPAFPVATIRDDRKDADFWLDQSSASRLPASQHVFLKMAQAAVAPYAAQGRSKTFTGSDTIVPGVTVAPSNGHTPGHSSYLVKSGAATSV